MPSRRVLSVLATVVLILPVAACAPEPQVDTASATESSSFGRYQAETGAVYDGWQRSSVYVPMTDGTRIAVDYFLPTANGSEAAEPLPAVLHYTRYIRAFEEQDGSVRSRLDGDPVLQHLSRRGYAIVVADARGTGASFGVHHGAFSVEETADSYAIIEWIAAQPWSNGKVGMQGRSYPGMTQYQAATQAPPALKAIFAEMAGPSPYDFVYRGGTYKQDFVDVWGRVTRDMDLAEGQTPARVDADTDGSLRKQAIEEHAENLWAHELVAAPGTDLRDHEVTTPDGAHWSWQTVGTIDDVDAIEASGVAFYHLVGWYDIYTTQQPWLWASLEDVPQKMMIGPWVHSGGYGGTAHKAEILRWYDHWLKGIENGVMEEAPIHYYVMRGNHTLPAKAAAESSEAGEETQTASLDERAAEDGAAWIATDVWPPPGASPVRWRLAPGPSGTVDSVNDGALTTIGGSPPEAESDEYRVDYSSAMGSFSRWMNGYGARREEPEGTTFFDERTAEDRKALTYTSPPMAEDVEIVGYPVVHLWLSSTHTDGDVFVYLEEIDGSGAAHYVTEGALRFSHRATAEPPFDNLGLPYHRSFAGDVEPLSPGEPTELVLDLMGTAIVIDEGHRIRVTIAGADSANHELYPDPDGTDAPTLTIWRGGDRASWIELPVMDGAET